MTNQAIPFTELSQAIRQAFVDISKYKLDKYVPEFPQDGKYFADCFNIIIVETRGDQPPVFYHTFSPYDIISKKAPDQALVFSGGELLLNINFAPYITVRTGAMSPLVLQALGVDKLAGRLLLVGAGGVASQALLALKEQYPDFNEVSYLALSGQKASFEAFAAEQGVNASLANLDDIGLYDYIICHSSAESPVLTAEMKSKIKPGAFIASFISESSRELAKEYYDTNEANVIIDWEKTIKEAPELNEAVDAKLADPDKLISLHDLFTGDKKPDAEKRYTVYRSHGTPMQNLAVLKFLLQNNKD